MSNEDDKEDTLKEAQKKLDRAVEEFFEESGWNSDGVLTCWIMVGHQVSYDGKGGLDTGLDTYPIVFMGGEQSNHISSGLLDSAKKMLDIDRWERKPE